MSTPTDLKRLFSSNLRIKVLSHFFFHPGESFHVRHLASLLDEPAGTLTRELTNLAEVGILHLEPVGNQKRFSINRRHPFIDDLRNIFLKTTGASSELKSLFQTLPGVEIAFIFGSYVTGEASATSDLDVMVVGKVSDREIAPLVAIVERRLSRPVNYVLYPRHEIGSRLGKVGDFINEVFRGPNILLKGSNDDPLFGTD